MICDDLIFCALSQYHGQDNDSEDFKGPRHKYQNKSW